MALALAGREGSPPRHTSTSNRSGRRGSRSRHSQVCGPGASILGASGYLVGDLVKFVRVAGPKSWLACGIMCAAVAAAIALPALS
jgi:hypothetical protein